MMHHKQKIAIACLEIAILKKEVYLIKLKRTTLSNKMKDHHMTRI